MLNAAALDTIRAFTREAHPALVLRYAPPARLFDTVMDYLVVQLPPVTVLESQHLDVSMIQSRASVRDDQGANRPRGAPLVAASDQYRPQDIARMLDPDGTRRYLIILQDRVTHAPAGAPLMHADYRAVIAFGAGAGSGLVNVWLLNDVDEAQRLWDALNDLAKP